MNPDQTAPRTQSDLGSYCLQYRLPKYISRRESRQHLLLSVGKQLIWQISVRLEKKEKVFRRPLFCKTDEAGIQVFIFYFPQKTEEAIFFFIEN